jgi:hypothetical protein
VASRSSARLAGALLVRHWQRAHGRRVVPLANGRDTELYAG